MVKTPEELKVRINGAHNRVEEWMEKNGITLTAEKTEVVYLCGRKTIRTFDVRAGGIRIPVKDEARYLGVILDKRLSFHAHIEAHILKSLRIFEALRKLIPRTRELSEQKRRLFKNVTESFFLYASSTWGPWM